VCVCSWKPPQPVAPWTKPLKTTHVYGKCPQANANMSRWGGTEDCLNLDIYVRLFVIFYL
jgi:carboxylesterase type B